MTLNMNENIEFIVAHLATPLGLAYSQAVKDKETTVALKNILSYINYGGRPHNITYHPDYLELMRLLEFYSRECGNSDGSCSISEEAKIIIRCIHSILQVAENHGETSEFLKVYGKAKREFKFLQEIDED